MLERTSIWHFTALHLKTVKTVACVLVACKFSYVRLTFCQVAAHGGFGRFQLRGEAAGEIFSIGGKGQIIFDTPFNLDDNKLAVFKRVRPMCGVVFEGEPASHWQRTHTGNTREPLHTRLPLLYSEPRLSIPLHLF